MTLQLMTFEVHLRFEDDKLLVKTLFIKAEEVIFLEVILESVVVDVILLLLIC